MGNKPLSEHGTAPWRDARRRGDRIIGQDFLWGLAQTRDEADDGAHRDSHAADDGLPPITLGSNVIRSSCGTDVNSGREFERGCFRGPRATGLLTQRSLLNRDRESLGGSRRNPAVRNWLSVLRDKEPGFGEPTREVLS